MAGDSKVSEGICFATQHKYPDKPEKTKSAKDGVSVMKMWKGLYKNITSQKDQQDDDPGGEKIKIIATGKETRTPHHRREASGFTEATELATLGTLTVDVDYHNEGMAWLRPSDSTKEEHPANIVQKKWKRDYFEGPWVGGNGTTVSDLSASEDDYMSYAKPSRSSFDDDEQKNCSKVDQMVDIIVSGNDCQTSIEVVAKYQEHSTHTLKSIQGEASFPRIERTMAFSESYSDSRYSQCSLASRIHERFCRTMLPINEFKDCDRPRNPSKNKSISSSIIFSRSTPLIESESEDDYKDKNF